MSDSDRGAYTPPTDSPLSFDARRPVRGGGGGSTLVISAVILIVLVIGAGFWLYRDGQRGKDDAPQPVGATVAATKSEPQAKDQPEVDAAAGLTIHKEEELASAAPGEPTFAPAPEAVQPRPEPQPTAPVQAAPLRPAAPPAQATPVAPAPKPAQVATAPAPKPAVTTPAPKPAVAAGGAASVQIGAFSSQALADKGWSDAAAVAPGMAAGKGKRVEAVDRDGKTLYRTTVTGFSSRADASAFCDRLKAAGKSCFVK